MSRIPLKSNEQIRDEIRRYGFTYVWSWLAIAFLFGVPFFFMFWLFQRGWWGQTLFFVPVTVALMWFVRLVFIVRANKTILTTHRIVDIDQRGFFDKRVSDIVYDDVEDVSGHVKGFFGTILKYGTVIIETGSRSSQVELDRVKNPEQIQQTIKELRARYIARYSHEFADQVADVIIEKLHELELPELLRVRAELKKRIIALKGE